MHFARTAVVTALVLAGQAWAGSKLSDQDARFLSDAAAEAHAEVELGRLAIERGIDPQVKAYGRRMVDDYSRTLRELNELAGGMKLPGEMRQADGALRAWLSSLEGAAFDRAYLDVVSARQRAAISDFETRAALAADSDVRAWADQRALSLRAHRDLAMDDRLHL
jgi:putative membrane protein